MQRFKQTQYVSRRSHTGAQGSLLSALRTPLSCLASGAMHSHLVQVVDPVAVVLLPLDGTDDDVPDKLPQTPDSLPLE